MRRLLVLACALALLSAGLVSAQVTTGRLTGQITDNEGKALPGVTVTISSDVLITGSQTMVSAADGSFAFNLLPPGKYLVQTNLSGFTPAELETRVSIGRTAEVRIQMVLTEFAEEIQVVAEAPVVDTSQVDTGQVFDESYMKNASIGMGGRSYLSIIGQAAGVAGTGNVNVYGSTYSENNYLVDGMTTTDVVTGTFGTTFNYDAIQEINFLTGGFEAEFGEATGGIVNLVTKSGGNQFSGTLDIRYRDQSFSESGDHFDPDRNKSKRRVVSATLGGPIIRDKLWFFVSIQNSDSQSTAYESVLTDHRKFNNYIAKATWQMSDASRLTFKVSGDPAKIYNGGADLHTGPDAGQYQKQGGNIWQVELDTVLSDNLLLTGQVGVNRSPLTNEPMSHDLQHSGWYNVSTGDFFNNYYRAEDSDRNRKELRLNATYFVNDLVGSHEFKAGVEYNDMDFGGRLGYLGDGLWEVLNATNGWYDANGDGYTDYQLIQNYPPGTQFKWYKSKGKLWTYFVQDAWRPTNNLTIKPGLRLDTVKFTNDVGEKVADLDRLQPRFGIAWDVRGDGKHVVRLNWGRFMHPTALGIPDFINGHSDGYLYYVGYEYWCSYGYCDPDFLAAVFGDPYIGTDPSGGQHLWYPYSQTGQSYTIDTYGVGNLKAPYADTFILGYEAEIMNNTSIEIDYVTKKTRSLMEDTCIDNTWVWGDGPPPSLDDPSTWTSQDACTGYVVSNPPGLRRDYRGYILRFESRARDWFHVLASYTWSKSQGNTDARVASPAQSDYDIYPVNFYNMYGYLGDHRRHRVKINGYFLLPHDITIGFDGYWSSAPALSVYGDCGTLASLSADELTAAGYDPSIVNYCFDANGDNTFADLRLTPRGARRGRPNYQLDLQVSKGFKVGDFSLEGILTIINAFSSERATSYYTYDFESRPWGAVTGYQQPRRYELGLRVEF